MIPIIFNHVVCVLWIVVVVVMHFWKHHQINSWIILFSQIEMIKNKHLLSRKKAPACHKETKKDDLILWPSSSSHNSRPLDIITSVFLPPPNFRLEWLFYFSILKIHIIQQNDIICSVWPLTLSYIFIK